MLNDQMMKSLSGLPGSEHNLGTCVEGQRRVFAPRAGMGCDLGGGYSGGCSLWVLILPTGKGTPSPGAWAGRGGRDEEPAQGLPACLRFVFLFEIPPWRQGDGGVT